MTPVWIPDVFAALMLAVAAVSAVRLAAAWPRERGLAAAGTDVAHLLMGIAMAGMLAPSLATLPNGAWVVVFCLLTAWFAVLVVRDARVSGARALSGGHCAPHLIHSAAMLYAFCSLAAPVAGGAGMGAMGGASGSATQTLAYPVVAVVFVLILAGYSVWDLDQLSSLRYRPASPRVVLANAAGAGIRSLVRSEAGPAVLSGAHGVPDAAGAAGVAWPPPIDAAGVAWPPPVGAAGGRVRAGRRFLLSPGTTVGCRIVMGVTMAYMLLVMI